MTSNCDRRGFLKEAAVLGGAAFLSPLLTRPLWARPRNPSSPVSIARCSRYDRQTVFDRLKTMLDQIGGIDKLVGGKTVAVKVNLTGHPRQQACGLPANRTYQIHPSLVLATATLLDRAGAKRIRFVEGTYQTGAFEPFLQTAGWDLKVLSALNARIEYEDTRNKGEGKEYHRVKVPWGGSLFPAYDINHSYVDCDVYVSLAKLKNHLLAGVTLSMKNNFGVTPTSLYGQHEVNENPTSNRAAIFHEGRARPADGLPQEVDPRGPRRLSYRVPRHTVDANGIRPIDLAIIDGVETVSGGEGPWAQLKAQKANVLLAGRNAVCADAIATKVMGYDPMAKSATGPFPGDNHLALAAELGLGTNNPAEIEVVGLPVKEALHTFGWEPAKRNP